MISGFKIHVARKYLYVITALCIGLVPVSQFQAQSNGSAVGVTVHSPFNANRGASDEIKTGVEAAPPRNEKLWLPVATEWVNRKIARFRVSPDQQLILYAGNRDGVYRVCPWVSGAPRQPFCRRFESRLVGACGIADDIIIVLASGDIHRVNYALVNAGGNFEPAYDHPDTLQLTAALLPEPDCLSGDEALPNIFAINAASELMQFDGEAWRVLDVALSKGWGPPQTKQMRPGERRTSYSLSTLQIGSSWLQRKAGIKS